MITSKRFLVIELVHSDSYGDTYTGKFKMYDNREEADDAALRMRHEAFNEVEVIDLLYTNQELSP